MLRPSERLTLTAALTLAALALLARPAGMAGLLAGFVSIAVACVGLARHATPLALRVLRDWLPVVYVPVIYLSMQPVIEATVPWRADATLATLDARWFPGLVHAWQRAFGRPAAFTDAVYVAYASYYFLPVAVAAIAWQRGSAVFEGTVFALLLAFYLSYLGYLLWPAAGPRVPYAEESLRLGGGLVSEVVRSFLRNAGWTTLDAFPSGHTAVAVVSCVCGTRLVGRGAATALWLWAAAIVFATVYIHVHYVVDLLAGLMLAGAVLVIAPGPVRAARGHAAARACSGKP